MTKAKSVPETILDAMSSTVSMPDVGERAQAFWSAQGLAADHIQAFVDGWYDRRREAAAAAADCCAQLFSSGGDFSAAPQAWTEWMTGSVERLRQDVQEQASLSAQLASDMAGAFSLNGAKPHKRRAHAELSRTEKA
jgi:hypothetical protein